MANIGIDCELVLDGSGYFVKPGSYQVKQPRLRQATYRADGSLAYVDQGPGKRTWSLTIVAANELLRYDGTPTGLSGQQYRDALHTSYTNTIGTTITFLDPLSSASINVHFDSYEERILDLHSQVLALATGGVAGASYEITITLLEA
jgi:hypothetical protein